MKRAPILLAVLPALAMQAEAQAEELRFVSCPIYRDTDSGAKSGCWLADDVASGIRYDVSAAPSKPDWNHAVLVEGVVSTDDGNPCGSVVLNPVWTSVLDEPCPRHVIPPEGFKGRRFDLPKTVLSPLYNPRPKPEGPYGARSFVIPYNFDSTFLLYQLSDYQLDTAAQYILAAHPKAVAIIGYADTRPETVSGRHLAETADLAERRAQNIRTSLIRLGVSDRMISIRTVTPSEPIETDITRGLSAPSRRRVVIEVEP